VSYISPDNIRRADIQSGRGTLSGNFLEKELGVSATMRNFNTMNRLTTMSREIHAQQEKH